MQIDGDGTRTTFWRYAPFVGSRRSEEHSNPQVLVSKIPEQLRNANQWVAWQWRYRYDLRMGKQFAAWCKTPISAVTGDVPNGDWDLTSWSEALDFATICGLPGIGVFLDAKDDLIVVDLDDCRSTSSGVIEDWASDIVNQLNSYTEVSPSGTGLHVFVNGARPRWANRNLMTRPEIFSGGDFVTFTGQHLPGCRSEIEFRSSELDAIAHRKGIAASFTTGDKFVKYWSFGDRQVTLGDDRGVQILLDGGTGAVESPFDHEAMIVAQGNPPYHNQDRSIDLLRSAEGESLMALDQLSGRLKWLIDIDDIFPGGELFDILGTNSSKRIVLLHCEGQGIVGLNIDSGTVNWHITLSSLERFALFMNEDRLVVVSDNACIGTSLSNGVRQWENRLETSKWSVIGQHGLCCLQSDRFPLLVVNSIDGMTVAITVPMAFELDMTDEVAKVLDFDDQSAAIAFRSRSDNCLRLLLATHTERGELTQLHLPENAKSIIMAKLQKPDFVLIICEIDTGSSISVNRTDTGDRNCYVELPFQVLDMGLVADHLIAISHYAVYGFPLTA